MLEDWVIQRWLYEDPEITEIAVTLTATPQRIFGGDPKRFAVFLPHTGGGEGDFRFGEEVSGAAVPQIIVTTSASWPYVTFDDIGGLITLPFYAWVTTGTMAVSIVALSIAAEKYHRYRRLVSDRLS